MRKESLTLAAIFSLLILSFFVSPVCAEVQPVSITVKRPEGLWSSSVTVEWPVSSTVYVQVRRASPSDEDSGPGKGKGNRNNNGKGSGTTEEDDTQTVDTAKSYVLSGPEQVDEWEFSYSADGVEISNQYSFELAEGEQQIIKASVARTGEPRTFVFSNFSVSKASGAHCDSAEVNVVACPDVMVRSAEGDWAGRDRITDTPEGRDSVTQTFGTRQREPCSFDVRVQNVRNATVRYTIHADYNGDIAVLPAFYYDGKEVTEAILSEDGFTPDSALLPGEKMDVTVHVVPVGRNRSERVLRLWSHVSEVVDPAITISPSITDFVPFAIPVDRLAGVQVGDPVVLYENKNLAAGRKGLINVGSLASSSPDLLDCIRNGYDGVVVFESAGSTAMLAANPGFSGGALADAVDEIVGETVRVPVFDSIVGQGNQTAFNVIGLGSFTVTRNGLIADQRDGQVTAEYRGYSGVDGLKYSAHEVVQAIVKDSGNGIIIQNWQEVR